MKVCCIIKLRGDTDIIEHTINHYYSIGVSDFFIMLHMPTPELINILENIDNVNIKLLYHDKEGAGLNPVNEEYLKVLTDRAQSEGFNYIIGTDSDEMLVLKKHNTIHELFSEYEKYETFSLLFKWANYSVNPNKMFYEAEYRRKYMTWTKASGKFNQSMYFVQGLHYIANEVYGQRIQPFNEFEISEDIAFYAHFPYRSKKQFVAKQKIQAAKFQDWRLKKLENNPFYFEETWDKLIKQINGFPVNLDNEENINQKNEYYYDPFKKYWRA